MNKKFSPDAANVPPPNGLWVGNDHLDSWKEIANYLRREVRTVQLWEKKEGLPVHRHFHQQLGSVFAFRSEIEEWKRQVSRNRSRQDESSAGGSAKHTENCIAIYISPLKLGNLHAARQSLCDTIASRTVAALEQLNPGQLTILSPKCATPGAPPEPNEFSTSPLYEPTADYILRWGLEEEPGGSLQLNATLVFARSGKVAWSQTYRSLSSDSGTMPAHVAERIAQCLWLRVGCPPAFVPAMPTQEKRDSRQAYLKGRYFWNQRNEEGLRKAMQCFESAIQEDPQFALPYSGLADALTLLSFYEIVSPAVAMPSARRAALKAIELDPDLAEAHASLADVLLHFDRDWQGADREYRRSIQCNPGYALGYHWYSNLLAARGQHEAAHIAIMHALEIDPVSIITLVWAGVTSHLARQFDEAIRHYQSALELDPRFVWAHMYMALALEQKGNFQEALREFETTIQLAGGSNCVKAMKAHTHAMAGDKPSAREILRELKGSASSKCMPSYDIAATYGALGESDRMVAWLKKACHDRNMKLFTLPQDPRFDPFRNRSEFKQIVDQMGLAQSNSDRGQLRQ